MASVRAQADPFLEAVRGAFREDQEAPIGLLIDSLLQGRSDI